SPFTAQAVIAAGARPRFADVSEGSLLLDPLDAAERANRRTAALLPVHLYGGPCDLPALARLARRFEIPLIQDACQAHGASFDGREPFTRYSPYVVYSFYPTKNLGCLGDAGAVLTNRAGVAHRIRSMRDGGRNGGQVSRLASTHSRMDEIQACFLRSFLPELAGWNAQREHLARIYDDALAGCRGVRLLERQRGAVHHLYVIRARKRRRLGEHLARGGIATGVHYPMPLHLQPAFQRFGQKRGDLPRSERACREILSLPLWPYMPESEVYRVAEEIRKFYGREGFWRVR
ncbi:MAG: DegT/DnrJ/EryC1/StrS family aminotransferase, partial [Gemmatimonadota bacterium]